MTRYVSPAADRPLRIVDADESFSNVSPQFALAYRFQPERMAYVSVGRGFKAGGFNPASPPGSEAYGEEHDLARRRAASRRRWANGRVLANAAVFFIDWDDLQLNLPNPVVPAQFYIANVGGAHSAGVELELTARPRASLDVFSTFGYTHARFEDGSSSSGVDVSGNELPNTPDYTSSVGAQQSRPLGTRATRVWSRRGRLLRRVPVRRCQYRRAGSVLAGELPRRCAGRAPVRRGVGQERVRHTIHSGRVCVCRVRAFRLRGRERAAAHLRHQWRRDLLSRCSLLTTSAGER